MYMDRDESLLFHEYGQSAHGKDLCHNYQASLACTIVLNLIPYHNHVRSGLDWR
jgi:hypothetical protein